MISVNATQLRAIVPGCRYPELVATCLNEATATSPISSSRNRLCMFIAQLAVESGQFNRTVENLNYDAAGLLRTWPTRFNETTALEYARKPFQIANKVYADRLGNGNEQSGDGWKYRGRTWIQVTGKTNTERVLVKLGLPLTDYAQLEAPRWAARAAVVFWDEHPKLLDASDAGDVTAATRIINGGENGLAERKQFWNRALGVIR